MQAFIYLFIYSFIYIYIAVDFCHNELHLRFWSGPRSTKYKAKKSRTEHIWQTNILKVNIKSK